MEAEGGIPRRIFRLDQSSLDLRVLAFTLGITVITGILFGLAPAIHGSQVQIHDVLKACGRSASEARYSRISSTASRQPIR